MATEMAVRINFPEYYLSTVDILFYFETYYVLLSATITFYVRMLENLFIE